MAKRIEVSGILASGKSTLCDAFAQYGFPIAREDVSGNPYFLKAQQDPARYEPLLQKFILKQRFEEVAKAKQSDSELPFVVDYCLAVDKAYADFYLSETSPKDMARTHRAINKMYKTYGDPDLVIHLRCDTDELLRRIKLRGRDFEQGHSAEFLNALGNRIEDYFQTLKAQARSPIMEIDTTSSVLKLNAKMIQKIMDYCA
jgi:deoxyadenosine/deoxycytidine kinase